MSVIEIQQAVQDFVKAQEYYKSIEERFSDNPDLLQIYGSSAKHVMNQYKAKLEQSLVALGISFGSKSDPSVDLWIRMEGGEFKQGKGPISLIGNYLQKINKATHQAIDVLVDIKYINENRLNKNILPSFDLAALETGSVLLGLSWSSNELDSQEQLNMFEEEPWEQLKEYAATKKLASEGFNLLLRTLQGVNDERILDELLTEYDERTLMKLTYYAQELTPSSRSKIDKITFADSSTGQKPVEIAITKETRKRLVNKTRQLRDNTIFVEGTGVIRALDLDSRILVARPFITGKETYPEIECLMNPRIKEKVLADSVDHPVFINGFLIYNKNGEPGKLEVEEIVLTEDTDDLF